MKRPSPTYKDLFSLLDAMGFQQSFGKRGKLPYRAFLHPQTDTVLAFARPPTENVTPADMLSTEVHLQARGITDQTLESLLESAKIAVQ